MFEVSKKLTNFSCHLLTTIVFRKVSIFSSVVLMKKENAKCIASGGSQGCATDDPPPPSLKVSLSGKSLIHHWFSQNKLNIFFLSNELFCFYIQTRWPNFLTFTLKRSTPSQIYHFNFLKLSLNLVWPVKHCAFPSLAHRSIHFIDQRSSAWLLLKADYLGHSCLVTDRFVVVTCWSIIA